MVVHDDGHGTIVLRESKAERLERQEKALEASQIDWVVLNRWMEHRNAQGRSKAR